MNDDMKMWEIDDPKKGARRVDSANEMETENALEEALVRSPDMLMPDLTLVGRQTPTDKGNLDLLGVDKDGRLVVFELKRGKLTREAVVQIIDYCSSLESLTEADLAEHIASRSGTSGVDKIDDFQDWYEARWGRQLMELRPIRMVLVGLGADARAHRMVEYLAQRDVDITLFTFFAYRYGDRTLLARQVEGGEESRDIGPRRKPSQAELRSMLADRARDLGLDGLWQDAVRALSIPFNSSATQSGITLSLPRITLPGDPPTETVNVHGSHSVGIDPPDRIRVTFYPAAVHVCKDQFESKEMPIPFECEESRNAPRTEQVEKQRVCRLNGDEWHKNKEALTALVNDVHKAWQEIRRHGTEE